MIHLAIFWCQGSNLTKGVFMGHRHTGTKLRIWSLQMPQCDVGPSMPPSLADSVCLTYRRNMACNMASAGYPSWRSLSRSRNQSAWGDRCCLKSEKKDKFQGGIKFLKEQNLYKWWENFCPSSISMTDWIFDSQLILNEARSYLICHG